MPMTPTRDFVLTTDCDALAVGTRLRLLRRSVGLTQVALVERLGTTQSAVVRPEEGHKRLSLAKPRRTALALVCDVRLTIVEREAV